MSQSDAAPLPARESAARPVSKRVLVGRGLAAWGLAALAFWLTGCDALTSVDASDQRHARRLCSLPAEAKVVSWVGYPARAGFGQREGLSVSGVLRPPAGWSAKAAGYRAAPWKSARDAVERRFKAGEVLDGADAIRCETAGDDVLRATTTRPCDEVEPILDVILCAVEPTGDVRVTIRSAY